MTLSLREFIRGYRDVNPLNDFVPSGIIDRSPCSPSLRLNKERLGP